MNKNPYEIISLFILTLFMSMTVQAQKNVTIILDKEHVNATVDNGKLVSLEKHISPELLYAIRNSVKMDAAYYKELNDILAGKYGTYYADLVKKELESIQSGKIKEKEEKLPRTAIVDVEDVYVRFVGESARLGGKSSDVLVTFTEKLMHLNLNFVLIEGHKKSNSISDYIVTTNRINAVKDYLIYKGIAHKKIKTQILLDTTNSDVSKTVKIIVK